MKKVFLPDTNVLLRDPEAIFAFEEHDVVIVLPILEELDNFKAHPDDRIRYGMLGRNARQVIRHMDALREQGGRGSLSSGVSLGDGMGTLRVEVENVAFSLSGLMPNKVDNYILGMAMRLADRAGSDTEVILVTNDADLRCKADALNIPVEPYKNEMIKGPIPGEILHLDLDHGETECFYSDPDYGMSANGLPENSCVIATEPGGSPSVLLRVKKGRLRKVKVRKDVNGICPRNAEQRFFADILMDPEIDCVLVNGCAGSGKTLLSLAAGLEWMGEKRGKRRMMIAKILEDIGKDVGSLPGTLDEKLAPWTRPFFDNLELLLDDDYLKMHLEKRLIEVDAVTFFRGRSIMNRWIIVDEIQNLPAKHLKTIVSRPVDGSKLILLGDLEQIDNPHLSSDNCALAHGMAGLSGKEGAAVLTMVKNERGRLARLAQYL